MKFDAYEYIGVIVPGSVVLLACGVLYPDALPFMTSTLSLGDFGFASILALVAGHLVQAAGNLFETLVWSPFGGMPTSWPSNAKTSLLTDDQLTRLELCLQKDFGCGMEALASGRGPTREIFVRVRRHGSVERIEKFNRNYGLMRGIAVAFVAVAVLVLISDIQHWRVFFVLLGLGGIATYRMIRFGIHYGREVYAEYLSLECVPTSGAKQ